MSEEKEGMGWFCSRINGRLRCLPFEEYRIKGFSLEESKPYEVLFPDYKDHSIVLDTSCGMSRK